MTPLCGGIFVRGASAEKNAAGAASGTFAIGTCSSSAAVLGQRAQWASLRRPLSQRKKALHFGEWLSSAHWFSGTPSGWFT